MPRLTADQWSQIRADREATGASFKALSAKYGVSDAAIVKVSGIVSGADPKKRAASIESRAEQVTSVIRLHQNEWTQHREAFGAAPETSEQARIGKTSAEMLKIRQAGERVAWGLGADAIDPNATPPAAIELVFRGT